MIDVILKKGKEKAVLHCHPWVFSGAVERIEGKPQNGEIVRLKDAKGSFMAFITINRGLVCACSSGMKIMR